MSRGWGRVERAVMAALEGGERRDAFELAAAIYAVEPDPDGVQRLTDAQLSATRRALARLRAEGLVDGRRARYGRKRWGTVAAIRLYDVQLAKWRAGGRA